LTQQATDGATTFRLSPQQEQLWRRNPGGPRLALHCRADLGSAAEAAVREALGRVLERHEILRTTFAHRLGLKMPAQQINDHLEAAAT
jgi:hypothetical protein